MTEPSHIGLPDPVEQFEADCAALVEPLKGEIEHTGGGCTAWHLPLDAFYHILVTSDLCHWGDPNAPEWAIGIHHNEDATLSPAGGTGNVSLPQALHIVGELYLAGPGKGKKPYNEIQWDRLRENAIKDEPIPAALPVESDELRIRLNLPNPEGLAYWFATCLASTITPDNWAEMRIRNRNETTQSICHSHDFCDANMEMLRALENLGISEKLMDADEHPAEANAITALWNAAWAIARAKYLTASADEKLPTGPANQNRSAATPAVPNHLPHYMGQSYKAIIDHDFPDDHPCNCGSCNWRGPLSDLMPIKDAALMPGDPSPAGRCPVCDMLAYVQPRAPQAAAAKDAAPWTPNKFQQLVLHVYGNGDFAHFAEITSQEAFNTALGDCGDTLLRFLMNELSNKEDCETQEDAISRLNQAIEDLDAAKDVIESGTIRRTIFSSIPEALEKAGYELISTGGGCIAYSKRLPDGGSLMITDEGGTGIDGLETEACWIVGRYAPDGSGHEDGSEYPATILRDAIAKAETLPPVIYPGMRMKLTAQLDRFPHFSLSPDDDWRGTVLQADKSLVSIKMDRIIPECAEWANCIQIYDNAHEGISDASDDARVNATRFFANLVEE